MSTSIAQSIVARDTRSATAVLNVLATRSGISEVALAQVGFRIPNVRREVTDYVARTARCASVGHVETSEPYDDEQRLYTCGVCYREQVRN